MLLLLLLWVTPALFLLSLNVSCEERSYLQIDTATVTATVASYFKRQYELNIGRLELRHCYCHSAIKKDGKTASRRWLPLVAKTNQALQKSMIHLCNFWYDGRCNSNYLLLRHLRLKFCCRVRDVSWCFETLKIFMLKEVESCSSREKSWSTEELKGGG